MLLTSCEDAPDADVPLLRLEADQVDATAQRVRWAGHRLDGDALSLAVRRERVAREHLDVLERVVHPQRDRSLAVLSAQLDPRSAVWIPLQIGEARIDLLLADHARGPEVELSATHVLAGAGREQPLVDCQDTPRG